MRYAAAAHSSRPQLAALVRWPIGLTALRTLERLGDVRAVVSTAGPEDDPYARVVWDHAVAAGIPLIDCYRSGWRERLRECGCDLLVSCAFPRILQRADIASARYGGINVHQSLLPRHRGPSPVPAAIIAGDRDIGVTVHWLVEEIDAGPILSQVSWPLSADDTIEQIADRMKGILPGLLALGVELAVGGATGRPQEHAARTLAPRVKMPWDVPIHRLRRETLSNPVSPRTIGANEWDEL